ncbi:conserved hypothetical protein [Candidatus Koribacter versatilis Ellin345]|uniref:Uncharacterized protein n=1 Tax=Koribacter versatilis (strain Ellin345) TaxID=204669 RepID=Q1IHL1_KORVE|nr:hypothetical protein [Candidatus Koribacter versatilis]ABF43639.1 conserved hypothetical protein [Candidatus Koribacter versatilis Ellin345]
MKLSATLLTMIALLSLPLLLRGGKHEELKPAFQTSDRCMACHNGLTDTQGKDISIGLSWRASVMGNSSRDPYWQASVRRETIDHPAVSAEVQDECSICHMPIVRYEAAMQGKKAEPFKFFPLAQNGTKESRDGVSCAVCHQISSERLGTKESFTGQFKVDAPSQKDVRPEFGPFAVDPGHQRIMQSSTGGFTPMAASHIRDSALCATCHTLYTTARGEGGKAIGTLPEQVPFLEWQHSSYVNEATCQSCHMPEVKGAVGITAVLPVMREGMHQHTFTGGNFLLPRALDKYRNELDTRALPQELQADSERTIQFLQTQAAKVAVKNLDVNGSTMRVDVEVENKTGHKLPTAYPSRRAWLWVKVTDRDGHTVFESGKLNSDGSIAGNDNDADPTKYEPYYREITSADQVQIFEDILGDERGQVTTGLLKGVRYLKDSRLLPQGFDKATTSKDIATYGNATDDPNFAAGGALVRYSVPLGNAAGPFHVQAELWYQPIGFRWAHNLEPYLQADEPKRFVNIYNAMSNVSALKLAGAEATR